MKLTKVYPIASFKALEDEGPGAFEAVVSVFGNVDFQGDRSMPGMFKSTLNNWSKSGDPVPCIWSHEWTNPDAIIGEANPNDMMEIMKPIGKDGTGGLLVRGTIDVHKPFAGQVFDLLKSRRLKEWSFAYDTVREKRAEDGANELLQVDLIEFGPCLKGANPETYTIGAKAALEKELDDVYNRTKIWQQRIDRIESDFDPKVADMLMKSYLNGPYKAPIVESKSDVSDLSDIQAHLTAEHDRFDIELEGLGEERLNSQHRVLHGRMAFDHDYGATDGSILDEFGKAMTKWDGPAAMRTCNNAGDFRSIAFEKANDSDPDTAAHWALPHHSRAHGPADDGGVSAALGRLNQTGPTVMSKESIRAHLERHQGGKTLDEEDQKIFDDAHDEALSVNEARDREGLISTTASNSPIHYSTTSTGQVWTISLPGTNNNTKIGRVIGAKAAEELKTDLTEAITGAVDRFVEKINGVTADDTKVEENHETKNKTIEPAVEEEADPDAEIKAKLAELFGEN